MKKRLKGHIFTNKNTENKTLFEHIKDGIITYYECCMKIPDGEYEVVINKKNKVSSCWKIRKQKMTALKVKNDFTKLEARFKNIDL